MRSMAARPRGAKDGTNAHSVRQKVARSNSRKSGSTAAIGTLESFGQASTPLKALEQEWVQYVQCAPQAPTCRRLRYSPPSARDTAAAGLGFFSIHEKIPTSTPTLFAHRAPGKDSCRDRRWSHKSRAAQGSGAAPPWFSARRNSSYSPHSIPPLLLSPPHVSDPACMGGRR